MAGAVVMPELGLDSTFLTARRQRTGTAAGEDTSPHTHRPDRPTRSQGTQSCTRCLIHTASDAPLR
eukprot:7385747-Prymnesium_polylepis.1